MNLRQEIEIEKIKISDETIVNELILIPVLIGFLFVLIEFFKIRKIKIDGHPNLILAESLIESPQDRDLIAKKIRHLQKLVDEGASTFLLKE